MTGVESVLVCDGCGTHVPLEERRPFRCPNATAADDIDHALRRRLAVDEAARERLGGAFAGREPNPFLRYRELLHVYRLALAHGGDDDLFCSVVRDLDARVEEVAGVGFRETPFRSVPALATELGCGELWIKDETGNVGGTHKGRHLAGVLIWLLLDEILAAAPSAERPPLAISSCGNAAWAATILARSVGWQINVYVPHDAPRAALDRLASLDAGLTRCGRLPGERGDPCYLRFSEAVGGGALPFTCQGPSNGLVIEGGQTLIWEIISKLQRDNGELDRLVIQTGGGALASACVLGWREAASVTRLGRLPKIHPVQTSGAWPLVRAYDAVAGRLAARHLGSEASRPSSTADRAELAALIQRKSNRAEIREELRYAASHRSQFMWPWEEEPHSLADAILDDETYDWLPLVSGMLESGGYPLVVSEELLSEANALAHRSVDIDVGDTGSAGLAGALELASSGAIGAEERLAVLFTGRRWR